MSAPWIPGSSIRRFKSNGSICVDINLRLEVKSDHREGLVKPDKFLEDSFNEELERIKRKAEELEKVA